MNWHSRYKQQASWTRDLRAYLFENAGFDRAQRILEVGCGTGAILAEINSPVSLTCTGVRRKCHGLDLDPAALIECKVHAPSVSLTRGDALDLPYPNQCFDIVYCHFLLLWVKDPLRAVCEMARVGKTVLAIAEPDYSQRVDEPRELAQLGRWQTESLRRQGANPTFGARLAETFHQAGITIMETGPIQSAALSGSKGPEKTRSPSEWEQEWEVLESDLVGIASDEEIHKMKILEEQARERGERILHIPTYFAWGKT